MNLIQVNCISMSSAIVGISTYAISSTFREECDQTWHIIFLLFFFKMLISINFWVYTFMMFKCYEWKIIHLTLYTYDCVDLILSRIWTRQPMGSFLRMNTSMKRQYVSMIGEVRHISSQQMKSQYSSMILLPSIYGGCITILTLLRLST